MIGARTLMLLGALLAAAPGAGAQDWGSDTPREGACFYERANYGGNYFCLKPGEERGSLPYNVDKRIASIRVFGRVAVMVYRDGRFGGPSERFEGSVPNLREMNWDRAVSSMRVRPALSFGSSGSNRPQGQFQGDPDRIVRRAYEDILQRQPDAAGLRLYRSRIIDDGWTEQQVRDALRKSPEYRELNTMTRAKATEIVRQAYLSVLGREPDEGSRGYVDRILRDKWTQQDVERELRRSSEYRNPR